MMNDFSWSPFFKEILAYLYHPSFLLSMKTRTKKIRVLKERRGGCDKTFFFFNSFGLSLSLTLIALQKIFLTFYYPFFSPTHYNLIVPFNNNSLHYAFYIFFLVRVLIFYFIEIDTEIIKSRDKVC